MRFGLEPRSRRIAIVLLLGAIVLLSLSTISDRWWNSPSEGVGYGLLGFELCTEDGGRWKSYVAILELREVGDEMPTFVRLGRAAVATNLLTIGAAAVLLAQLLVRGGRVGRIRLAGLLAQLAAIVAAMFLVQGERELASLSYGTGFYLQWIGLALVFAAEAVTPAAAR